MKKTRLEYDIEYISNDVDKEGVLIDLNHFMDSNKKLFEALLKKNNLKMICLDDAIRECYKEADNREIEVIGYNPSTSIFYKNEKKLNKDRV